MRFLSSKFLRNISFQRVADKTVRLVSMMMIFILAGLMCLGTVTEPAAAQSLKAHSEVESDQLFLSDLFEGIPPHRDKRIGRSPNPGDDLTISAPVLSRIAQVYNLSWRPNNMSEKVVIRRSVSLISEQEIVTRLKEAIREQGVQDEFDITFLDKAPNISLPRNLPRSFELASFSFTPGSDRFEARIVAPSRSDIRKSAHVFGRIDRVVDVPVLTKSLRNGTVIGDQHIKMVSMRIHSLGKDILLDPSSIIGKTPDRYLVSHKPIRREDIRKPKIVQRGERVTMIHRSGPLFLSAVGKSMEDGSEGDIIRVINIDSNKNLNAEIIGQGTVKIIQ